MSLGFLGGRRPRLYRTILDRFFNPKNDLYLVFFKKLTIGPIGPNSSGSKLLIKQLLCSKFDPPEFEPMDG